MAAESSSSDIVSFEPQNGADKFEEAKALAAAGRLDEAVNMFEDVIGVRPDAASPHWHLARVLVRLAQYHFQKANEIKPQVLVYKQLLSYFAPYAAVLCMYLQSILYFSVSWIGVCS